MRHPLVRSPVFLSFAALLALVAAGCASSGPGGRSFEAPLGFRSDIPNEQRPEAPVHRTEVPHSRGQVAAQVREVYRYLGLEAPSAGDAEPFTYLTPAMRITGRLYEGERNSEYIDCGSALQGERADLFEVEFALATRLREEEDGGTLVETRLEGRAWDRYVNEAPVFCAGTGKLESQIGQLLRQGGVG